MRKNVNMTEKQIIDRLDSINLSLRQKKDLIDIIKDITANSGGGGTSTDKDTLDVYVDLDTPSIIVNDKTYAAISQSSEASWPSLHVYSKELYNMLYKSLINTDKTVYIKTIPTSPIYLFCEASITAVPTGETIMLTFIFADGILNIIIFNR